ncbi:MAG TPA: TipC family immunity protein [Bacillota bacterium]
MGVDSLRYTSIYYLESDKLIIKHPEVVSEKYRNNDYSTNDPKEIAKFMEKHHLTEEDLAKYQDYFLYEKVLTDWFEHNPKSHFSLDDLGKVEIVKE